jgi:hypothetical protein
MHTAIAVLLLICLVLGTKLFLHADTSWHRNNETLQKALNILPPHIPKARPEVPGRLNPFSLSRSGGPPQASKIEIELGRHHISQTDIDENKLVLKEYLPGYAKYQKWEYSWIDALMLSLEFISMLLESVVYRGSTWRTGWQHVRIVVLQGGLHGFGGKSYGYTDGVVKRGVLIP